jgi:hypothetical protein
MVQANSFVALGVKAGRNPTKLRFVTKADKATPGAGYLLTARILPEEISREIGTTDREGRVVVPAGFANGLIQVRLLAGGFEPMVEIPVMPGELTVERVIPFEPKPQAVALEVQVAAIRDTVIDLIAVRARLKARLEARQDAGNWPEIESSMAEYYKLPPKSTFTDQLANLKDQARLQQEKSKTPVLTKTAQAQLADVQTLVDRYLDDDFFNGYAEGIKQYKAGVVADQKAEAKKKEARAKAAAATTPPKAGPAAKTGPPRAPGAAIGIGPGAGGLRPPPPGGAMPKPATPAKPAPAAPTAPGGAIPV